MAEASLLGELDLVAIALRDLGNGQLPDRLPEFHSPRLQFLQDYFSLSQFDQLVLLLTLGAELEPNWGNLCAQALQSPQQNFPSFQLAIALAPQPQWSALAPHAPLRHWKMIEIGSGNNLTNAPLRLDERILHFLLGVEYLDERLAPLTQAIAPESVSAPEHQAIVQNILQLWHKAQEELLPIFCLTGPDHLSKRAIAFTVCQELGLSPYAYNSNIPLGDQNQYHLMQRLWEREYLLGNLALVIPDYDRTSAGEGSAALVHLLKSVNCPLFIFSHQPQFFHGRSVINLEIDLPAPHEQLHLWKSYLGTYSPYLDKLTAYFNLSPSAIKNICAQAQPDRLEQSLWEGCRTQARPHLDRLCQRITSQADWSDLVLPARETQILKEISAHVRQRLKVYQTWGMGKKNSRGLGISALFAGASGTGKTLSAEVLGQELQLDVYRIDLSAVVSKYIGETEKNLREIFDGAESGGVILLFDEADAIFGKRSEVKDSHDRHANIEVSYLLQRMESYRGLAILTTNLKNALDQAFLRRLRFVVQFPFPDAQQRMEIWRRAFPPSVPTLGLDFSKLAKLNVAGGNIRNMALNSAFMAADANQPIQMHHILESARVEYMKLERPMTDSELKALS